MPVVVPGTPPEPTSLVTGQWPLFTITSLATGLSEVLSLPNGWVVLPGVMGLDDPPRNLIEIDPATGDGAIPMDARYTPREVFLPLHYAASDSVTLRETMRRLASLCEIHAGEVMLEVAYPDGDRRTITGRMSQSFGQSALGSGEGGLQRQVGLTLRCPDPFFAGLDRQEYWTIGDSEGFLSEAFLPVGLSESQVLGDVLFVNEGDAPAYPVWVLFGPLESATILAADTSWEVPPAGLASDEVLVIDTRRGVKTCTVNDEPAWERLSTGSVLGTLPPGEVYLNVEAVGATTATRIAVTWQERWLTAW